MSKKNSSVILKNRFEDFQELSKVYQRFRKKILTLKKKSYLVAVSGGPDSLALAALSKALNYEKKIKFYFVLINHNIRKKSSNEAVQVKNLLSKKGISIKIIKNTHKIKTNIQNQARIVRYDLLKKFCQKNQVKVILTAHNLEDQVETFFIRLSRGSGLTGLSAMKPLTKLEKNIDLFRPLLDIKKKTLIKISNKIFGKYFKDPSNTDNKYLRTKIRNLKKPLKESGITYDQIIRSINNLASSKATLEDYNKIVFKKIIKRSKKEIFIDFKRFNQLKNELKINVINYCIKSLRKNYYNPRSKKINNLIQKIRSKGFSKSTLGGCVFYVNRGVLCLKSEKK